MRPVAAPTSILAALAALVLGGCAAEEILHGLAEPQANEVVVALDEAGIPASKEREGGADAGFTVSVPARDAGRAQRVLAERSLPRARPPGFAEVFSKGSMVPTPTEEHALYLHALGGELARSVEAIDGVVEARVHVGLPQPDPLRPGALPPARAAVLVKCRRAACTAVRELEPGIRALVAGAADGLDAGAVSVVVAEAAQASFGTADAPDGSRSHLLIGLAAAAALGAAGIGAAGLLARARRGARA
ncbi:MAG TPA: secretion protein [Anaeromyxobacter sp.]|nr:secretion protein [Anaeromyxobacter sp.]